MEKLSSLLSNLLIYFTSIGLFIVAVGLVPIILVIWTPVLIYRKIASVVAPYLYTGVTKILTHRSTTLSIDNLHNHEESLTIASMAFEGNIPLKSMQQIFLDRVFQMKLPNGEVRYPEFKQHYFDCLGFRFWKNCKTFDINDHVKLYNEKEGQVVSEEELNTLKQTLLNTPFKKNFSPWVFVLVHNYISDDPELRMRVDVNTPMSVILMKSHHGLCDGFSMQKLTTEALRDPSVNEQQTEPSNVKYIPQKSTAFKAVWGFVSFPFRLSNDWAQILITTFRKGPLHVPPDTQAPGVYAASSIIHTRRIKRIKNELGVAFTSVLLCICTGAFSKLLAKKNMKLPKSLPVIIPIPLPRHPDKLRNHMTNCGVNLPLSPKISLRDRLNSLHLSFESIKSSTVPATLSLIGLLFGGMFTRLMRPLVKAQMFPVVISSFPNADTNEWIIAGHRAIETHFYCGLLNVFGMGIYIMTKGEDMKLAAVGNSRIMSSEDVRSFIEFIELEIQLLEQDIAPHSVKVHLSA